METKLERSLEEHSVYYMQEDESDLFSQLPVSARGNISRASLLGLVELLPKSVRGIV